jgi:predicted nucleotidyltransferase
MPVRTSFDFIDLKSHLEDLLARPMDLATPEALHRQPRHQILQEAYV